MDRITEIKGYKVIAELRVEDKTYTVLGYNEEQPFPYTVHAFNWDGSLIRGEKGEAEFYFARDEGFAVAEVFYSWSYSVERLTTELDGIA